MRRISKERLVFFFSSSFFSSPMPSSIPSLRRHFAIGKIFHHQPAQNVSSAKQHATKPSAPMSSVVLSNATFGQQQYIRVSALSEPSLSEEIGSSVHWVGPRRPQTEGLKF